MDPLLKIKGGEESSQKEIGWGEFIKYLVGDSVTTRR